VNIELTEITRSFGKNKAVTGVNLEAGPGLDERGYSTVLSPAQS
jgi:hypothetical protein